MHVLAAEGGVAQAALDRDDAALRDHPRNPLHAGHAVPRARAAPATMGATTRRQPARPDSRRLHSGTPSVDWHRSQPSKRLGHRAHASDGLDAVGAVATSGAVPDAKQPVKVSLSTRNELRGART